MTVSILIITHDKIGKALLDAAINILSFCPLTAMALPIPLNCDPDAQAIKAQNMINILDDGNGVLILTDIYGSTPSNISCTLSKKNENVQVISGINLPMLIRVLNYPNLDRDELVQKAVSGGKEGIMDCESHFEI